MALGAPEKGTEKCLELLWLRLRPTQAVRIPSGNKPTAQPKTDGMLSLFNSVVVALKMIPLQGERCPTFGSLGIKKVLMDHNEVKE